MDPSAEAEDTHKLLPQYLEERLMDIDSDDNDVTAAADLDLSDNTCRMSCLLRSLKDDGVCSESWCHSVSATV